MRHAEVVPLYSSLHSPFCDTFAVAACAWAAPAEQGPTLSEDLHHAAQRVGLPLRSIIALAPSHPSFQPRFLDRHVGPRLPSTAICAVAARSQYQPALQSCLPHAAAAACSPRVVSRKPRRPHISSRTASTPARNGLRGVLPLTAALSGAVAPHPLPRVRGAFLAAFRIREPV